uniref:Uncharacterized protein n=1 Tax=Caenorhabditis japonica TaxID=281687 RepID=A0A8R1IBR5_CAEJA
MQPPAKLSSHTSAFPYFVDSKASEQTTSPPNDDPKSLPGRPLLCIYKNKSRRGSSEKIYSPEAKSKKKDAKFS